MYVCIIINYVCDAVMLFRVDILLMLTLNLKKDIVD